MQAAQDAAKALQTELWTFEILEGYVTQYEMATTPPAPTTVAFASKGLCVDAVLGKEDKAGANETMAALGLPRQAPFATAVKKAKKVRDTLAKQAKRIPPVLWVRKARTTFGQGTPRRRHRRLVRRCRATCAAQAASSFFRPRAPSIYSPIWSARTSLIMLCPTIHCFQA